MRPLALCFAAAILAAAIDVEAQGGGAGPLTLLDVPFISQSELLCGGAAAAMVLRYWGEREISAESFSDLVDRAAGGIRTDALVAALRRRGWTAEPLDGTPAALRRELSRSRPVVTLIEDRPSVFHYVVVVGWHERGVVLHDPARAPFVVMSPSEFERRWDAARRWMVVVLPPPGPPADSDRSRNTEPGASTDARAAASTPCEQAVAEGVRRAQANELDAAERVLASAVGCPTAVRELAGIRVLQKRWPEAEDLAASVVAADETDEYAWRVLATSRFVRDNRVGALAAWNRAGEPRLDLLRVDGLVRTRPRVVERMLGSKPGDVLTPARFTRAQRKLGDLPAAMSTRLDYVPVRGGLAELRAAVAERPLLPTTRMSFFTTAAIAAVTRELRMTAGALTGGGEAITAGWRFWPHRGRLGAGLHAPAPWGGVWSVTASAERQPFTDPALPVARRVAASIDASEWLTDRLQVTGLAGIDEWADTRVRGRIGGRLYVLSREERLDAGVTALSWPGGNAFSTIDLRARARSRREHRGVVIQGLANLQIATTNTPLDLWWAGDTGQARTVLLRAHPLLDHGRLRTDRLGRIIGTVTVEGQRWWRTTGLLNVGAAAFVDAGRTGSRYRGGARNDVDVGVGARLSVTGLPGTFSADLGKGLSDGATALSVTYQAF